MILYILKFSACLALFLAFYKLVLEKENMHTFKRFFLLGALILSLVIPLITFTYYVMPTAEIIQNVTLENAAAISEVQINYLPVVLWSIYGIGLLLFGFKFIKNLSDLSFKIKRNPKQKVRSITNVLLQDLITPHTFFNFIFYNKQKYEANEIPQEVLWHEQTHASQKHSIDVVFIELLQVIFWFNPLLYIIKHVIKLNHEFLADQSVLNRGVETTKYQKSLLAFSSNAGHPQLANAINYSLIKKRFTVMKTQTSKRAIWLRSLVLLPLLAITLFSFSKKVIIEKTSDLKTETINDYTPLTLVQEKATKAQVKEYNKLAKKYNDMPQDDMIIRKNDIARLKQLYSLMSEDQKKNAETFPDIPDPIAPIAIKVIEALPPNATAAQKRKYKEGYKAAKAGMKAQKEKLVKVREIRSDDERLRLKEEKMAHRESQAAARVLKLKAQKGELVKVREIQSVKLKEERLAHRESQAAARVLKLKAQKGELVKVREIQSVKLKQEKLAHRESQAAARVLKLKAQKGELVKIREIRSTEERKRLKEVKLEHRESQAAARVLKLKAQKGELVKVREIQSVKLKEEKLAQKESRAAAKVIRLKAQKERRIEVREILPPPPPKNPIDHIKDMAKKGATFIYDGASISSKKAIQLMRSNKKLNVVTNHTDNNNYVVTISKRPIVIED